MPMQLVFFNRKDTSFSKKQFQTENSGFVKTCDEHVLREGVPYLDFSNSYKSSTYSVASIWRKMVKSSTISWVETSTGFKFSKLTKDSLTKDRILCLIFLSILSDFLSLEKLTQKMTSAKSWAICKTSTILDW